MDLFKDKEFIEVLKQIEESSWLSEYISQFPPEVLSNIIRIFGTKYHIKQRGESIVEVCPKDVSDLTIEGFRYTFAEPMNGIRIISGNINGLSDLKLLNGGNEQKLSVIHYCVKGRVEIQTADGKYAFMKPGVFCVESRKNYEKNFNFHGEDYEGVEIAFELDKFTDEDISFLDRLGLYVSKLEEMYDANADYIIGNVSDELKTAEERLKMLMHESDADNITLLVAVIQIWDLLRTGHVQTDDSSFYLTKGQRSIVYEVEKTVTEDLQKDYTTEELAKRYNISSVSLNKYFGIMFGGSIHKYLQDRRMKEAARLLADTNKSIAEIAQSVGYENQSKFGSVFKRKYGMAPLEYRRCRGR